jgi:exonuclease VII small subunit
MAAANSIIIDPTSSAAVTDVPIAHPKQPKITIVSHDHNDLTDGERGDAILDELSANTDAVAAVATTTSTSTTATTPTAAAADVDPVTPAAPAPCWVDPLLASVASLEASVASLEASVASLRVGQANLQACQTNSGLAGNSEDVLEVMLNNAGTVAPNFPQTVQAVRALGGPALVGLLTFYGLPPHANIEQRRSRFVRFIGLRLTY